MWPHSWAYTRAGSRRGDTPVSADELRFALPMLLRVRVISLWTPPTSSKRSEPSKKGQRKKTPQKKGKKEQPEPCFPNHNAHWGFSCRGEGEINNFVYHGFFSPFALSFHGLFCFKVFFFLVWRKAGWLMQIPSLFTLQFHPSLFWEAPLPGN